MQRGHAGFTLLELLVVLVIMGLVVSVLAPSSGFSVLSGLSDGAAEVAADLRFASEAAGATGRPHRVVIDLDEQVLRVEHLVRTEREDEGERRLASNADLLDLKPPEREREFRPVDGQRGYLERLSQTDVTFGRVTIGDDEYDRGEVAIGFSGIGGADPARILLVDDAGKALEVRVVAFTGEVRIVEDLE